MDIEIRKMRNYTNHQGENIMSNSNFLTLLFKQARRCPTACLLKLSGIILFIYITGVAISQSMSEQAFIWLTVFTFFLMVIALVIHVKCRIDKP